MKKIEIITKNNGKKKSQVVKIKSKEDLGYILSLTQLYPFTKKITDIDLTGDISFKLDGEKIRYDKLRDIIRKELKSEMKTSKKDSDDLERDDEGRIIIHSRHGISFNKKKNKKLGDMKSKKNKKKKVRDKKNKVEIKKRKSKKNKKGKKGRK